jgi:hypothetical protein
VTPALASAPEAARVPRPAGPGPDAWPGARAALVDWAAVTSAVPGAVREAAGWPAGRRIREADRCADVIASGGAVLRADPAASGRAEFTPAQVTDAIITGLGILACRPGGAGFMGAHWHSSRPGCLSCPGPGTIPLFGLPGPAEAPGVVFTPRSLADDVAANALGAVTGQASGCHADDIKALRVADPFCGTGAFLLAAARYLGDALAAAWDRLDEPEIANLRAVYGTPDRLMAVRALVIAHCVYGADLDPVSVELAGLALQLLAPECGTDHILSVDDDDYMWHMGRLADGERPGQHARLIRPPGPPSARLPGLRAGDSLAGRPAGTDGRGLHVAAPVHWPDAFPEVFDGGGFDAVIGNPPFLGGLKIPGALGRDYREYLVDAVAGGRRTTADLAMYCWLRMHQLAQPGGVVGIVGPDCLLRDPAGGHGKFVADLRDRHGWQVYRKVTDLKWPARTAAVRVCTVWTCQWFGADPPAEIRNVPEPPPPPSVWQHCRSLEIEGHPVDVYERRPRPARPRRPRKVKEPALSQPGSAR